MFKIKVDQVRANRYLKQKQQGFVLVMKQYVEQVAQQYFDEIKDTIQKQKGKWVPLTPEYQAFKARYGLDPRILIATGGYEQSIVVEQVNSYSWKVYPKGNEKLAEWLEFGTSSMPSRPHWRLAQQVIEAKLQIILQNIINQSLIKGII